MEIPQNNEDPLITSLNEAAEKISANTLSDDTNNLRSYLQTLRKILDKYMEDEKINVNIFKSCLITTRILFERLSDVYFIQTNIKYTNYFISLDISNECIKIMILLELHQCIQHNDLKSYIFQFITKLLCYISHVYSSDINIIKTNMIYIIDILKTLHRYFTKSMVIDEEYDEIIIQILICCCKNDILSETYKYLISLTSILSYNHERNKNRIYLFLQNIYSHFHCDSIHYIQIKTRFKIVLQVYVIIKVVQNMVTFIINQERNYEYYLKYYEMLESIFQALFLSIIFEYNNSKKSLQSSLFLKHFIECATIMSRFIKYPIASLSTVVLFRITGNIIMKEDLSIPIRSNFMEILTHILCFNEKLKDKLLIHPKITFLEDLIVDPVYHQKDILCHLSILSFISKEYSKSDDLLSLFSSYSLRLIHLLSQSKLLDPENKSSLVYIDLLNKLCNYSYSTIESICPDINYTQAKFASRECISDIFSNNNLDGGHFFILSLANSNNTLIRSKALKCLLDITEVFPLFVEKDEVLLLIKIRLHDRCANVRKFSIKIIAKCVLYSSEDCEKYIDMILERIIDSSVSVRELVVKILHSLLISSKSLANKPRILLELTQRINDLPSVRKKIALVFKDIWSINQTSNQNTILTISDSIVSFCVHVGEQSEILLNELFSLLKDELTDDQSSIFFEDMKKITDHLLNVFISTFTSNESNIISIAIYVYSITKMFPMHFHLYVPILISLQYSHVNNTDLSDNLFQYVCKILSVVLPTLSLLEKTSSLELEESLIKVIVQRCSAISDAIYCLKVFIFHHTNNLKPVYDLFNNYLNFIHSDEKTQNDYYNETFSRTHNNICRILYTLGILTKYFVINELITDTNHDEISFIRVISNIYLKYILSDDIEIKIKAIFASTSLFNHYPKYFMDLHYKKYFIAALLDKNDDIKHRILKSLLEFALFNDNMSSGDQIESCHHHSDYSYEKSTESSVSMVLQSYISCIQHCYFTTCQKIRHTIYLIIRVSIKLGLLHPQAYIPLLIAMTNDPDEIINKPATILMKNIYKRYSGNISNYIKSSIDHTFKLYSTLFQHKFTSKNIKLNDKSYLFNDIYQTLNLQKYKKQFIQALLKCFDSTNDDENGLFITLILAYLPYKLIDEILFLLYHTELAIGLLEDPSNSLKEIKSKDYTNTSIPKYLLLTKLKQFIKKAYSINDEILDQYSPQSFSKDSKCVERNSKFDFHTNFFYQFKSKNFSNKSDIPDHPIVNKMNNSNNEQNILNDITNEIH